MPLDPTELLCGGANEGADLVIIYGKASSLLGFSTLIGLPI